MTFLKGTLALSLSLILSACGGGGGDGYFGKENGSSDNNSNTTHPDKVLAQSTLDSLKKEGQYLFGNYDPNDATTAKGYIDHALDTFGNGVIKLSIDVKAKFDKNSPLFTYYKTCHTSFDEETPDNSSTASEVTPLPTDTRSCYVINGNSIKTLLGTEYANWDFEVTSADLKNLKPNGIDLNNYIGMTSVIIYENQNADKNLNDIVVTGKFSYPYQQSWSLSQITQIRYVSIPNSDGTNGGFNIYQDPTSIDGQLFVVQADSSYSVLTNDNPNTPNIEPVSFTINSIPGDATALATYRIKASGEQVLNLPSITALSGTRIENEAPSSNTQSFTGSIHLEGNNIFTFKKAMNGTILKFKHIFNGITFEGQSTNNNGTVNTILTQPSNLKY